MDLYPITVFLTQNASEIIASVIPTVAIGIGLNKYFGNTPEKETISEKQQHTEKEENT